MICIFKQIPKHDTLGGQHMKYLHNIHATHPWQDKWWMLVFLKIFYIKYNQKAFGHSLSLFCLLRPWWSDLAVLDNVTISTTINVSTSRLKWSPLLPQMLDSTICACSQRYTNDSVFWLAQMMLWVMTLDNFLS